MELVLFIFIAIIAGAGVLAVLLFKGGNSTSYIKNPILLHIVPAAGQKYERQQIQDFWQELTETLGTSLANANVGMEILLGTYGLHWIVAIDEQSKAKVSQIIFKYFNNCRIETVSDYAVNLNSQGKLVLQTEIRMEQSAYFPILEFGLFPTDPIDHLNELLPKLNQGEECWIQLVVKGPVQSEPYHGYTNAAIEIRQALELKNANKNLMFNLRFVVKAFHPERATFLQNKIMDYFGLFNKPGFNKLIKGYKQKTLRQKLKQSVGLAHEVDIADFYRLRVVDDTQQRIYSAEASGLFHLPAKFSTAEIQTEVKVKPIEQLVKQQEKSTTNDTQQILTLTEVKPVISGNGDPLAGANTNPVPLSAEEYENLSRLAD